MTGPGFSLIETLRFEPGTGFRNGARHRARMRDSAAALGLPFDPALWEARLDSVTRDQGPRRVRLELFPDGTLNLTDAAFVPLAQGTVWRVAIARGVRLSSADPLLRHKTSRREVYAQARAEYPASEVDEVLLLNERGEICEGTITSVFADGTDRLLTPPLACGLLAGIERQCLLESGTAMERVLTPADLHDRTFRLGNSLRGLIGARLV